MCKFSKPRATLTPTSTPPTAFAPIVCADGLLKNDEQYERNSRDAYGNDAVEIFQTKFGLKRTCRPPWINYERVSGGKYTCLQSSPGSVYRRRPRLGRAFNGDGIDNRRLFYCCCFIRRKNAGTQTTFKRFGGTALASIYYLRPWTKPKIV